ncbi:hypothetical protein [Alkalilimnicola ehrlichii]|nr:hypothetical protein [Alkalilimnicola ehrlichii]
MKQQIVTVGRAKQKRLTRTLMLSLCLATTPTATAGLNWDSVELHGDVIAGYFYDYALLPRTMGRERQMQLMRAVLGVSVDISPHWRFFGEYNFVNTEIYRDDDERTRHDWYRNLGVDLVYYGNTDAREAYFEYSSARDADTRWLAMIGRQFTPVGFHPDSLPYWSRIDAPHTTFLSNGLFTGINFVGESGYWRLDTFYFMGQDHPDRSYNYYGVEVDPQVKGNAYPGVAARLMYDRPVGRGRIRAHASGHFDKLGSAIGSLERGKHNDYRMGGGFEVRTPLPRWLFVDTLELGAEAMRFRTGLTADGVQGNTGQEDTYNIYRNGYHGTIALERGKWRLHYTYEQLDRADSQVFGKVAELDPKHPAMDEVETSHILGLSYAFTDTLTWRVVYRALDNPFPEISGIGTYQGKYHGEDKILSDLRWRF